MIIDELTYILPLNNYVNVETIKKQIIIGNTFNHDMKHIIGWLHRYNGKYKKTAPFTIDSGGVIYKHFNPKLRSRFFKDDELNKNTIVVLLENDGWLIKDIEKNTFINWVGDIYNGPSEIMEKKWRGYSYWAPYTEKQIGSTIELVDNLCEEFEIPKLAISHNTKIDKINGYSGVLYRSNLEKHYTDLTPAWDCNGFKERLEKKDKIEIN
jgi:hypothetical protein